MRFVTSRTRSRLTPMVLVLGVGLGAGAVLVLGDDQEASGRQSGIATPAPAASPAPTPTPPFAPTPDFAEPPAIRNRGGGLKTTLVAKTGPAVAGGLTVQGMQTYARPRTPESGRALVGPTLHVEPGHYIDITFRNELKIPSNADPKADNCPDHGRGTKHEHGAGGGGRPGHAQVTNLHFHGLHVTPREHEPYGDTVLVDLHKGRSHIRFKVPHNHAKGTFWYHAHRHGCTDDQVFRGLAGLLIIGDSRRNLPARFHGVTTRNLALKDVQVGTTSPGVYEIAADHRGSNPTQRTVNGQVRPKLTIRPGETQMWRLANISSEQWYNLALVDDGGAPMDFTIVAQDGNSLPTAQKATPVVTKDAPPSLVIPPGRRFDVLVRAPQSGGFQLKTLVFPQGHVNQIEDTLATVAVAGAPAPAIAEPTTLTKPPQGFPKRRGKTRSFTFGFQGGPGFVAEINDLVFDAELPGASPLLERTERWVLRNETTEWHPFHIHQNDFRVLPSKDRLIPDLPGVQDIVSLPPAAADGTPSTVEIDMPFTRFPGKFVFHCHILDHEDAGMMSLVHVRKKGKRR